MSINADRIRQDIDAIADCTATPGAGATRPTFSAPWRAARDYVIEQLQRCDCVVRVDPVGNVHARSAALSWEEPVWLSGSHLDTVPHGGHFDGVVGVVVPLELLRAANEEGRTRLPLELVVFAEEEGTTFGLGMLGSHAWVGSLSVHELGQLTNAAGESYLQAGIPHGVLGDRIAEELLQPGAYRGFVEVHIEQGAGLWRNGGSIALVNAIAGRRQYQARLRGRANHAGSTAMADRQDALTCAADVILQLESLASRLSPQTVITVGQLTCRPNAVNVVPGEVELSIDFRSPDDAILQEGHTRIESIVRTTVARRGLHHTLETTETLAAQALDAGVCAALQAATERAGIGPIPVTASGALHDAAILAPHLPSAMLFVASREGVSHNPAEFSRVEDITTAATILWELVTGS